MIFSDFDYQFIKRPSTSDLYKLEDQKAIEQSIKNILKTSRGEKLFNSRFGVANSIREMLFNNSTDIAEIETLKEDIKIALRNFEKRIKVIDVQASFDNNTMYVSIKYMIKNTNIPLDLNISLTK